MSSPSSSSPLSEPSYAESLERIRQQFDEAPYPRIPLDHSPKAALERLFIHNLVTSYYLRYQQVVPTAGKVILDAGCGSGYKSLILAEANPGAHIVGIDLSGASVQLARQRLAYHGFANAEFHALSITDLPQLGMSFDYINCDEVLYLLPDPLAGLQAMKAVLKPNGLLRFNLHNRNQRSVFYWGQELFGQLGLTEHPPGDEAIATVVETMDALKDFVKLKALGWKPEWAKPDEKGQVLWNYLVLGDKGHSVPELFQMLAIAELEFVSLVDWRHWDVTDLFQDPDNLPAFWAMSLESASTEEKLHLHELIHPVHRLMDCWCAHPQLERAIAPVDEWTVEQWLQAQVHLHPQLNSDRVKQDLLHAYHHGTSLEISRYIPLPALGPVMMQSHVAICLLPLWDGPQPMSVLVKRYHQIHACDPITLEPLAPEAAFATIQRLLQQLHSFLYVLLTQPDGGNHC